MWNKNHLSNHNKAEKPFFTILQDNGNVDILNKQGDEKRIGVNTDGMYILMRAWLQTNHMLDREKRDKLIELLK
ncbi:MULTISPECIES: hypothetical protein [Bacillus]|uniref:hypothetical protein n=1 Tax=Bacillus TaxID=1386 RepID=UPI000976789E|nr:MULTISPECIES: hypothetical protein [Bacillus]MCY7629543.1 hypothetical protein [Bacillus altitudinis]OMP29426.1 hypothetical protein BAE31_16795 [Bacillus sp. I-2]PAK34033.1 hypothetical protein CHI04_12720 [Bacillus safensis]